MDIDFIVSPFHNSEDTASCQESTFVALYTASLQCCCDGGEIVKALCFIKLLNLVKMIYLLSCFPFQALPILLDGLIAAWGAILISVTLILLFGEVNHL